MPLIQRAQLALLLVVIALTGGCERARLPSLPGLGRDAPATEPVQAVTLLVADLRRNDLAAYTLHAVPPALHKQLQTAWSEGRTIWPLAELPLDDRLPGFITALASKDAEKTLLATYNRQFAGAHGELRSAASTVGLFAVQYVNSEGDYSEEERDHYVQLIAAFSQWGRKAPLGDPGRARKAIPQLAAAARATGLAGPDAFAKAGMERSLRRLGPFFARFKQVLTGYDLDLDAALDSVQADLAEQTGDSARVRLRYTLGTQPIDAYVMVERHDGRWYLRDALRRARAGVAAPPPEATAAVREAAR